MNKLFKIVSLVFIIIFLNPFPKTCESSLNEMDLIDKMVEVSQGEVTEYGIKLSYLTKRDGYDECNRLIDGFNLKSLITEKKQYYVSFKGEQREGYITGKRKGENFEIVFYLVEKSNKNNLISLTQKAINLIGESSSLKLNQYIKAKLGGKDLCDTNEQLIRLLNDSDSENLESLSINNGYFVVANTKRYTKMINNGEIIDLNYSLQKYTSGNYLIIGTPEIVAVY